MNTTTTQFLTLEGIIEELNGQFNELELRRAIAQGRLIANRINPDDGDKKKPRFRIVRSDFESFITGDLTGVRLPADLLVSTSGFQIDRNPQAKIVNAFHQWTIDLGINRWLEAAERKRVAMGASRLARVKEVQIDYGNVVPVMALANGPARSGFASKIRIEGQDDPKVQTLGEAYLESRLRRAMRKEVESRFGRSPGLVSFVDRVYWTRNQFQSLVLAVRARIMNESVFSRTLKLEGTTTEGNHYSFWASATFDAAALVSGHKFNEVIEGAF